LGSKNKGRGGQGRRGGRGGGQIPGRGAMVDLVNSQGGMPLGSGRGGGPPGTPPGGGGRPDMTPQERDALARERARRFADKRQREGREQGVAEAIVTRDGHVFEASSSDTPYPVFDPQVKRIIDRANPQEEWHGHCALPRAIEDALTQNPDWTIDRFRGASVGAARIAPEGSRRHGEYVGPCRSCLPLFDELELRRAI